jgi:cytosine/adenosine deaminase-related metal-dependent hydrolase
VIRNVHLGDGSPTDLLVVDARIAARAPDLEAPDDAEIEDGGGCLLLPGLVNAHAHADKTLLGLPWHRNVGTATSIRGLVEHERRVLESIDHDPERQSARFVRAAIAAGTTHIRTHVDVDGDLELRHAEALMGTRELFADEITIELVAFPQAGLIMPPGSSTLVETALSDGLDVVGGIDPTLVDRDPVRHLDTVFEIAARSQAPVDIHLHEPGELGAVAVEMIAERTARHRLQGRVTISHAYCLGGISERRLAGLVGMLVEQRITVMSLGAGRSPVSPLLGLHAAGVALCTGSDGVRDAWGPYNSVDLLERVFLLGYRLGLRRDADLETLLGIATVGGATAIGIEGHGIAEGDTAGFFLVAAGTAVEAIATRPPRRLVVSRGRIVARNGEYVGAHPET